MVLRLSRASGSGSPPRRADADDGPAGSRLGLAAALGVALVPLAIGWFIAHDLTLLLFEGQNFLALLSDPLGRGWDLFGTIDRTIDYASSGRLGAAGCSCSPCSSAT